jgi:hypothetical protein
MIITFELFLLLHGLHAIPQPIDGQLDGVIQSVFTSSVQQRHFQLAFLILSLQNKMRNLIYIQNFFICFVMLLL